MKILLSVITIVIFVVQTYAQDEKSLSSEIKNVTVYQQGAQVSRQSNVITISKGNSTLVFKGLPAKIMTSSVQASATNDVMIVSVTHSMDYLNVSTANREISSLESRKLQLNDSIKVINNMKGVYLQEKNMILANTSLGGDNGVNINELEQAASFFRRRLSEIESINHKLDNILFTLKNEMVAVSRQLMELNSKINQPTSTIKMVVSSKNETKTEISLNYFISDARWIPAYDVRIKDTDQPLQLFYKAKVIQNTEEDWKDVKLTLSTGNPSISNTKPELSAYYLTFDNYYSNMPVNPGTPFRGNVRGRIVDAQSGEPLPGVNVVVKGTVTGVVTDVNGNYSINLPGQNGVLVYSYIGYETRETAVTSGNIDVKMVADVRSLDEVVVIGYGSAPSAALSGRVAGLSVRGENAVKKKEQIPMAIEKRQLTTEFRIDIPYSIPSDNQPYDVSMVEYEIDAQYEYFAVPKLSTNAFLLAKIPDWIKYNLVSGNTCIFFKGIYQGESYLDLDTSGDTLSLSVGRDKDIVISREIQKDYVNRSITGTTKKEQKGWMISVKNNKTIPVNITIEDQYPVSKTEDIKVDLMESSGAKMDESTGKLTWDLILDPSSKKTLDLRYSVKYPSYRNMIVE